MKGIDAIGRPAASPAARRNRATGGFVLPPETSSLAAAPPADISVPVFATFMEGLLGLQEQAPDAPSVPAVRDREARRHGQAVLSLLAELQLVLVGSGSAPEASPASLALLAGRLSALTDAVPVASDPGLRAIIAAIALRARVELARRLSCADVLGANRQNPSMSAH
jgi:hypothetical protein